MKIVVIGAGAFGTAMAVSAAAHPAGHAVTLWARDAQQLAALQATRSNARYLPGVDLPPALALVSGDMAALAAAADLVIVATPMAALRSVLTQLRHCRAPLAWLCKGFESTQGPGAVGLMAHEVCAQAAPDLAAGVLSGPSFAAEVASFQPTALVAASRHERVRTALVQAFHSPSLRVYANDDIVGVEAGGAIKNVLAIATGLCDGLQLGLNARAALITRGLAEMTRLGVALGARTETFMGLSGVGDLVLTATGDLSRNRRVGLLLAQGQTLAQAVASLGHVAEGVYCARTVVQRARHLGVDMPISEAVVALLDGQLQPLDGLAALMDRDPKGESESV
ncbi:MAG: NAD(P)-dependent glycerol-3-phosphate dehydrogenase [Giesbergeria sp.]|nr:NAD(P)-dependent glycerol-3-phosphate dehydrogenase [Giesbergeria sp.]